MKYKNLNKWSRDILLSDKSNEEKTEFMAKKIAEACWHFILWWGGGGLVVGVLIGLMF